MTFITSGGESNGKICSHDPTMRKLTCWEGINTHMYCEIENLGEIPIDSIEENFVENSI